MLYVIARVYLKLEGKFYKYKTSFVVRHKKFGSNTLTCAKSECNSNECQGTNQVIKKLEQNCAHTKDKIYVVRQRIPTYTVALGVFHYFEGFDYKNYIHIFIEENQGKWNSNFKQNS